MRLVWIPAPCSSRSTKWPVCWIRRLFTLWSVSLSLFCTESMNLLHEIHSILKQGKLNYHFLVVLKIRQNYSLIILIVGNSIKYLKLLIFKANNGIYGMM